MHLGQLKTIENANKTIMQSDNYKAVYLQDEQNEVDFYLFTQRELNVGINRAKNQPEEEANNQMSIDLTGAYYGLCVIIGIVLGAIFF